MYFWLFYFTITILCLFDLVFENYIRKKVLPDTFLLCQELLNVSSCLYGLLHFCDTFVYGCYDSKSWFLVHIYRSCKMWCIRDVNIWPLCLYQKRNKIKYFTPFSIPFSPKILGPELNAIRIFKKLLVISYLSLLKFCYLSELLSLCCYSLTLQMICDAGA